MPEHGKLLESAVAAAEEAAAHIRTVERPSDPSSWGKKGTADFVTQVDRDCERLIAEKLLGDHPTSMVMGEELSPDVVGATGEVTWVVDPLDGTTNYLHDYPAYAVSVAAVVNGTLIVGVVIDVLRERVYHATIGGGAWCNGSPILVSPTSDISCSLIGTGFPFRSLHLLPRYLQQFTTILTSTSGVRRAGAAALDLVDVAAGRLDGFWELSLAPWDVAAGTLIIREAGGVVTDTCGGQSVVRQGPIVAGNPMIHSWLLEITKDDG